VLTDDDRGKLALGVKFNDSDGETPIRYYAMRIYRDKIEIAEFDRNWASSRLAGTQISPSQFHKFQLEYESGALRFLVDGSAVQLQAQPDLPIGSTWHDWFIEGFLAGPEEIPVELESHVDWVAVKP